MINQLNCNSFRYNGIVFGFIKNKNEKNVEFYLSFLKPYGLYGRWCLVWSNVLGILKDFQMFGYKSHKGIKC